MTVIQPLNRFPTFNGTLNVITAFITAVTGPYSEPV